MGSGCGSNVDVVFAFDATEKNKNSYEKQKQAAKIMARKLKSLASNVRVGLVNYGSYAWTTKSLNHNMSTARLENLIDYLPTVGEARRIDLGLAKATSMFMPQRSSNSKSRLHHLKAKLLIVFVSGKPSQQLGALSPKDAARPLHDLGVQIVAVGVDEVDHAVLRDLVHDPSSAFNLPQAGEQSMELFTKSMLDKVCKNVRKGIYRPSYSISIRMILI